MDTKVMLDSGHDTNVEGKAPVEIIEQIRQAIEDEADFVFLQPGGNGARNRIVVDPRAVVMAVAVGDRGIDAPGPGQAEGSESADGLSQVNALLAG